MATVDLNTGDYSDEDRVRLGQAVTRAREAAGWATRKAFAEHAGVSLRSLAKLESPLGELPVGRRVMEAVARALPGWTEEAPRTILDGGPVPSADATPDEDEGWTAEDEDLHQALTVVFSRLGLKPTAEAINAMRAEWEKEQAERHEPNEAGNA